MNDIPASPRMQTVEEVYGSAFADEEAFREALDHPLNPRGFDLMFDLVAELGLPPGSAALDVGARAAYHSIELSRRFGTDAYEAMLTDSLWGVYQMIGKLNPRIYVLSR